MPTPPTGYRHETPIQVRWADMDALGHVNNATYLTYIEQARVRYFGELGLWDGSINQLGLIMAKVTLEFRMPVFGTDDVYVYTRCARLGNRSFDTEQIIARRLNDDTLETVSFAVVTVVVFDYKASKSTPIPEAWRKSLIAFEPAPIRDEGKR